MRARGRATGGHSCACRHACGLLLHKDMQAYIDHDGAWTLHEEQRCASCAGKEEQSERLPDTPLHFQLTKSVVGRKRGGGEGTRRRGEDTRRRLEDFVWSSVKGKPGVRGTRTAAEARLERGDWFRTGGGWRGEIGSAQGTLAIGWSVEHGEQGHEEARRGARGRDGITGWEQEMKTKMGPSLCPTHQPEAQ